MVIFVVILIVMAWMLAHGCSVSTAMQTAAAAGVLAAGIASRLAELLSRPVDQDLLGGCGWGVLVRSFDELAVDEGRAGADQGHEVRRVDGTPAVLG